MWTKERIIAAYRRAASENGDVPLGQGGFDKVVPERAWRGKFFARFSDLVRAAGYEPRAKNARLSDAEILAPVAELTRRCGRLPTEAERIMQRREDVSFPSNTTLRQHFGGSDGINVALIRFCRSRTDYDDVLTILESKLRASEIPEGTPKTIGFVYLMKYGRGKYKIGQSKDVGKRNYDLKLLVPEPHRTIHYFETDDPMGIEKYWHNRFADKLCDGTREYFALSPEDVAAFKRRKKFM